MLPKPLTKGPLPKSTKPETLDSKPYTPDPTPPKMVWASMKRTSGKDGVLDLLRRCLRILLFWGGGLGLWGLEYELVC